jgi:prefoldin subunit 5
MKKKKLKRLLAETEGKLAIQTTEVTHLNEDLNYTRAQVRKLEVDAEHLRKACADTRSIEWTLKGTEQRLQAMTADRDNWRKEAELHQTNSTRLQQEIDRLTQEINRLTYEMRAR